MEANATTTAKQKIQQLKKQKAEIHTASPNRVKVRRIQRKIKLLKRQTRDLAGAKKLVLTVGSIYGVYGNHRSHAPHHDPT